MELKHFLNLIRVRQWYKNLVIFLALFFSGNLFHLKPLTFSILGFISLCLISSTNYIINDLVDLKKDQLHPEKKLRPLANNTISKETAIISAIIFFLISVTLAAALNINFLYLVLAILILSQIYTFYLKHILFGDILAIASLFVLRAISGAYLIEVKISPWLILCPFFLSIFLTIGKRHADLLFLKEKAHSTRKVLKEYTLTTTNSLMVISTTLLIISYALYSFLSQHQKLLYTLPFALYVIFRYFNLINEGSEITRHPEKSFRDKPLMIGTLLWVITTLIIIYI
ncbi:decaprenyl-phosphate phosphoribosyltransferase [Candidatus Woesearchaeota archaeon]|jgi:4-hydroxybenzoate polyprenyltransferase|nr:decaprenyl-phosphate phosphoribosyltransferase [Candidatus Woesearchaeota archaeon]